MLFFDIETEMIAPLAVDWPKFVVMGFMGQGGKFQYTQDYREAQKVIQRAIENGQLLVAHNGAFDLGVLGFTTKELDLARVHDTMIVDLFQRLARSDCARSKPGPPKLRALDSLVGGLPGKDTTRLSYRPGVPLTQEQLDYLRGDVQCLPALCKRQRKRPIPGGYVAILRQVQANIALMRLGFIGIRVDRTAIKEQRKVARDERRRAARILQRHGLYTPARTGPKGGRYKASVSTKLMRDHVAGVCSRHNIPAETTDKGSIKTDKSFLVTLPRDEIITNYLEYRNYEKIIGTFLNAWDTEHGRIYPKYRGMMRTGRTSSHGPNLQQIPSRGKKGELKRIFLPEEGRVFSELDYGQLELCVLAELTGGKMQELINKGRDLHIYLASVYFNKDEAEVTKEERQLMKAANYGLPGGMGVSTFRRFIRANGQPDPGDKRAADLKNAWLAAFPEMEEWLKQDSDVPVHIRRVLTGRAEATLHTWDWIGDRVDELRGRQLYLPKWIDRAVVRQRPSYALLKYLEHNKVHIRKGHERRPVSYTEQRNTRFQGLAAYLTKRSLCYIMDYMEITVNAFVHDSVLISHETEQQARKVGTYMIQAAREYLPTTRVTVEISGPGGNWYEAKTGKKVIMSNES